MRAALAVPAFIALTVVSWGVWGPVLHTGQDAMGGDRLRPFICVGLAYFVIAVVIPVILLRTRGEKGRWTRKGTVWSLIAGVAGALGSLGIILAFENRGDPVFVMPLVFGCAPVVNTLVTMFVGGTMREVKPIFLAGLALVVTGAVLVLVFKPEAPKAAGGTKFTFSETDHGGIEFAYNETLDNGSTVETRKTVDSEQDLRAANEDAFKAYLKQKPYSFTELLYIALSIGMTAVCWGGYGPVLHTGQMKMEGSRLRPFICVGLSYFAVAVVIPLILLGGSFGELWNFTGVVWSLGGGTAGAMGALGIIYAFNFGGKPIYVMPLVFGGAPVVNTFYSIAAKGAGDVSMVFFVGLAVVAIGAVTVLIFAPKPAKPHGAERPKPQPAAEPAEAAT